MSGILDSHTRVLDVFLTQEGRRQLSVGGLRIEHISFSDDDTFYQESIVSGSEDASNRLFFESANLPQDQITFESDDSGRLQPFKNINGINIINGQVITTTGKETFGQVLSGSSIETITLDGLDFSNLSNSLLKSSIDNFKSLRMLGTIVSNIDRISFQKSIIGIEDFSFLGIIFLYVFLFIIINYN